MSLSWSDIDARWPDAGVMWDRDVAPTLDWEPVFVERSSVWEAYDSVLFADDSSCWHVAGMSRLHGSPCRCLVWDGTGWIERAKAMQYAHAHLNLHRSGKQAYTRALVAERIARGEPVLVVTPEGDVDGREWLGLRPRFTALRRHLAMLLLPR